MWCSTYIQRVEWGRRGWEQPQIIIIITFILLFNQFKYILQTNDIYLTRTHNMFRQKYRHSLLPLKKKIFSMNEEEFPDIASSHSSSSNTTPQKISTSTSMDFKNCYKPEDLTIPKNDRIPGWVYGFGRKTNHHVWFENDNNEVVYIQKPQLDNMRTTEEIMFELYTEWEKYKEEYIELFGYDEYEKMFMPPRDNYDDDTDQLDGDDAEYHDDADEAYDEYGDAYDETYYEK